MSAPTRKRQAKSIAAEATFRQAMREAGHRVMGPYVNSSTFVDVICSAGHTCRVRPSRIGEGVGACIICARRDKASAGENFRRSVEEQGAQVLGEYAGAHTKVLVRCPAGHYCHPIPNRVQQGARELCTICSGRDPALAEAAFRRAAAKAGVEVLGVYVTARVPVLVRCAQGHLSKPMPDSIQQGQGFCKQCRYTKDWDTLYVVVNRQQGRIKFGITYADERPRLRAHRAQGYRDTIRILRDFPDAYLLEQHIIVTLRDAGIKPVHRREYFDITALAVVLDIIDGWSGP